jgi:hypothetical protein
MSNAALAISVASVNGLNNTEGKVAECFPGKKLDGTARSVDATCIATALHTNSDELHYKQGVSGAVKECLWEYAYCETPTALLQSLVVGDGGHGCYPLHWSE